MVARKKELNLKKTNLAKDSVLKHLSEHEESFDAFKFIVESMYKMNDVANYKSNQDYKKIWTDYKAR